MSRVGLFDSLLILFRDEDFVHNDYPWRKVFAPFKSCLAFVGLLGGGGGGGGRLDETDTCICHRQVKSDIARPTSVDQVNHTSL